MIVNSHPYNPTGQQAQQQHCIGIASSSSLAAASGQAPANQLNEGVASSRQLAAMQQQQNSLYGTNLAPAEGHHQSQNMFDLMASLQQQQQQQPPAAGSSLFDSAYGGADPMQPTSVSVSKSVANSRQQGAKQQEVSLYSPSSSSSLLYHIYDQINLPSAEQQQQQQQRTLRKPAGQQQTMLFGQPAAAAANSNSPKVTTIQQHELYGSMAAPQLAFGAQVAASMQQQQQQQNYAFNTGDNQQRLFAADWRQATRQRPLSSSSSQQLHEQLAGGYGRFATTRHQHQAATKGHSSNLATLLQHMHQQQRCSGSPPPPPLPLHCAGPLDPMDLATASKRHQQQHHQNHHHHQQQHYAANSATTASSPASFRQNKAAGLAALHAISTSSNNKWKRAQLRARRLFLAHNWALLKLAAFVLLLAFCLMSLVKLTMVSQQQQQQQAASHFQQSRPQLASNLNPLLYPPPVKLIGEQSVFSSAPDSSAAQQQQQQEEFKQQDVLKSKLLIGEFVVLSQNYSHSASHKSLLAETLVKLMDQVFLSTDVRRVYSRMEITNMRPNRPSGIIVDCNIVLSDSIGYAAQLFGIALYESLAKSNEKLANQASFIIDKNSIRFNTVPDKDLRSGLIPPGLIAPGLTRELASASNSELSGGATSLPSGGNSQPQDSAPEIAANHETTTLGESDGASSDSPVVWSAWSQWSSCVDKNGLCDPQRLHSRLRKCLAQRTGDKVEASQCQQRFSMQDRELEVSDCTQQCASVGSAGNSPDLSLMSDAPQGPQTAPSVMLASSVASATEQQQALASFLLPAAALGSANGNANSNGNAPKDGPKMSRQSPAIEQHPDGSVVSTERMQLQMVVSSQPTNLAESSSPLPNLLAEMQQQQQQQMSCSNCTSDEICLLLVQQKVPFCAKIKDRQDASGCGGWCKQSIGQLCQPLGPGSNAFKCIHDSECLADEWRCHDSACIPLSKHCDGHSNCYDNSDERDCPAR